MPGRPWPWLTMAYLAVLLATTVLLRHVSPPEAASLLSASSTDVEHLARDPIEVLVTSALWLPDARWLPHAVVLLLFMAPLERRIGALRVAAVFLSAHVLATLLTELPLAVGIALGWLPAAAAHTLDVGASYGTYALVGACAALLSPALRRTVFCLAWVSVLYPLAVSADMTSAGHVLSLAIGISWWPWLRHRFPAVALPDRARARAVLRGWLSQPRPETAAAQL